MIRATLCALLLSLPGTLTAQLLEFRPFAGHNGGLADAPAMVGLSATVFTGPVGVRASGAMDGPSSPLGSAFGQPASAGVRAWSADLDMLFSGPRAGIRLGRLEPHIFTGFGFHGRGPVGGAMETIPVWSYGGGLALPLTRWLAVDAEARYRMPHESDEALLPAGVGGGWDFRGGLSVRLGSSRATPRAAPVPGGRSAPLGRAAEDGRRAARDGSRAVGDRAGGGRGDVADGGTAVGSSARAALTLDTADRYLGVPYVWGGESPSAGFDCSGFVQYVFARNGVELPRVSRDQARAGRRLATRASEFQPGDLLFFAGSDGVIDHVAIYVGDNTIIHSSASRGQVAYDRLDTRRGSWYATHLVAARRVIPEGTSWSRR